MLSYRHGFHAGNFADVLKHVVLVELLGALARKESPYFVLDTHAGAGRYDLAAPPASAYAEFANGIGRLWRRHDDAPPAVAAYLERVRAMTPPAARAGPAPRYYPGSPALARSFLRAHDRLVCCELHPADFATLSEGLGADARIELRNADGYSAMQALLPPSERRGLVLVDPAYELAEELERLAAAFHAGLRRFGHGVFALWYPITRTVPVARLHAAVADGGARKVLRVELCVRPDDHPLGLNGSGLLIANPPYRTAEALSECLGWLLARLAADGAGRTRVDWLVPE